MTQQLTGPLRRATSPGNSDPTGDEWPMFHGQLNHSGISSTIPCASASPLWSYSNGDWFQYSSPAVVNGRIYVGCEDDKLYCLNATTGAYMWSYTTGSYVESSPAVANGMVFVGSQDSKLYCLNATNGTRIWSFTAGSSVWSSPAVAKGFVYVGSDDYTVYCLREFTGTSVWNFTTTSYVYSSPAVSNGLVYVGSDDFKVYCINATTGKSVWNYTTGDYVWSSPAVASGLVYVGCNDGKLYCLNATKGTSVWNCTTGNSVISTPAVDNGRVYVGNDDGKMYCVNAITGNIAWSFTTGNSIRSSPAVARGFVYVGSYDNNVYCLNATTGREIWFYPTSSSIEYSSPAITNGLMYVGSDDTKLYCLPMSLVPGAPRSLIAMSAIGNITLSWQPPATSWNSTITNYHVYQGTIPGKETIVATIGNVTKFIITGLKAGQTYYFKIAAVSTAGEGLLSDESIATFTAAPSNPNPNPNNEFLIWILFITIIFVVILSIAVIGVKRRSKNKKKDFQGALKSKSKGAKGSYITKQLPSASFPLAEPIAKKAKVKPDRVDVPREVSPEEMRKVESEVTVDANVDRCIVCKQELAGDVFICPSCKNAKYHPSCKEALIANGESCWVCHQPFLTKKKNLEEKIE